MVDTHWHTRTHLYYQNRQTICLADVGFKVMMTYWDTNQPQLAHWRLTLSVVLNAAMCTSRTGKSFLPASQLRTFPRCKHIIWNCAQALAFIYFCERFALAQGNAYTSLQLIYRLTILIGVAVMLQMKHTVTTPVLCHLFISKLFQYVIGPKHTRLIQT